MAEDIADDLSWMLQLNEAHSHFLGQVRHWENLKMATDENNVWVKGFTQAQIDSVAIKSIPFTSLFYVKDNLLFPAGSLLPARKMPSLLWTPVERALPVTLHGFNHNLFNIPRRVGLRLLASAAEQAATALLTDLDTAGDYIRNAPAIRLQPLSWTVINADKIFITGKPLLPLNGKVYWQRGRFIYPVGFMPEFDLLEEIVAAEIDPMGEHLIWWADEENYSLLHTSELAPLSIGSWRQTVEMLKLKNNIEL